MRGNRGSAVGTGARCHAVRVRMTGQVDTSALAARLAGVPAGRLWVEDVPVSAADPAAERRRALELGRPADPFRAVLLRWADGAADLVLVARRDVFDRAALLRLSAGADPGPPAGPRRRTWPWPPRVRRGACPRTTRPTRRPSGSPSPTTHRPASLTTHRAANRAADRAAADRAADRNPRHPPTHPAAHRTTHPVADRTAGRTPNRAADRNPRHPPTHPAAHRTAHPVAGQGTSAAG
ncbi:hypothetical protein ACE1SV_66570 [Streptomyces sp. E-15]